MKVIDLINMIANGEKVPLIKDKGKILHWNKEKDRFEDKDGMNTLYEMDFSELNDEVEVIEEDKKIEKIPKKDKNGDIYLYSNEALEIIDKLNEIIDYINKEK